MLLTQYLHHKSFWMPNSFDWNNRSKDGNGSRNGTSQLIGFAQFEIFTFFPGSEKAEISRTFPDVKAHKVPTF